MRQSKSFVKRIYYIVHETSTCWDNIRSSMSNVLTLILTLFPMTYKTTEYNLMQRKWILLLWDSKSKHWCTHKVFMLAICHITHDKRIITILIIIQCQLFKRFEIFLKIWHNLFINTGIFCCSYIPELHVFTCT